MYINAKRCEYNTVMAVAQAMCSAARTAPKTRGIDHLTTAVLSGDDLTTLADKLAEMGEDMGRPGFTRDAENLRDSQALVLIATKEKTRGLNEACRLCHAQDCADCAEKNSVCIYNPLDLGIAIGSAVSVAADARVDSRVMFSAGMAAKELDLLGRSFSIVIGIPLSVSGKSPYFDR